MSQKNYNLITGLFFTLVALLHVYRIMQGFDAVIGEYNVSMWASYLAALVTLGLAYYGFRLSK